MAKGCPTPMGLYDPAHEHDACGVGFIANLRGRRSHDIITRGIEILKNLTHRGAVGADPLDGDGAGLSIQLPDDYYREIVSFDLPPVGEYAAGLLFLPKDPDRRRACEDAFDHAMVQTELAPLGWRDVPTDNRGIGRDARSNEPVVRQVFVGRGRVERERFELMLYLARRRAENSVRINRLNGDEYFYVNSLSTKRILYKGMLLSDQLSTYYPELADERVVSAVALVHQRYSTNTFPTWDLAQPFRLACHNGEINTLRGNINHMRARQVLLEHPDLGFAVRELAPVIINEGGSDTACLDNVLEMLVCCGYTLEHALALLIPEAWETQETMPGEVRDFYRFHSAVMEPWDGPANIAAFDGEKIVACLDRNGLRPVRWWLTDDDELIYASEAGVLDVPEAKIRRRGRLGPGKMLVADTRTRTLEEDSEVKLRLARQYDYGAWVRQHMLHWKDLPTPIGLPINDIDELRRMQRAFGYTLEERREIIAPMCINGQEPIGSMGNDTPLAVLSDRPKLLSWYFKQCFAQVTNPPIDPIREGLVMSLRQFVGTAHNVLFPMPSHCRLLEIEHPILSNQQAEALERADRDELKGCTLDITFPVDAGPAGLAKRVEELTDEVETRVAAGYNVLVLSDRGIGPHRAPVPALLAVSALHHHLIRCGKRSLCSLIVRTAEAREVHHFVTLCGYGATAVNPYLAFDVVQEMISRGMLASLDDYEHIESPSDCLRHYTENYVHAIQKGMLKVFSKMGISTLQSYAWAQVFEAVGLKREVVDRYFTGTSTRIEGVGLNEIATETLRRHHEAFAPQIDSNRYLERGGEYSWRRDGEYHLLNPETIALVQQACRNGDYATFKRFSKLIDDQSRHHCTLRGLFRFKETTAIPIDEVEPIGAIMKRFASGAMSLGSISPEAHECLAIAMNRIGGKSNTGEGGEDPKRFVPDENGDIRRSAIKQVASGRFGVTPWYLANADQIQIKMAQGAKPGEGGHLPGPKVTEYIAWLRHSVPGVSLISPPPHHDIYSIEDLAQLIFDLKNANPKADISVKLVSSVGVGTVAAGVAKGHADHVVISGYDGGTGASPVSSIKHAGVPWELGLAETQQTLVLNDLRGRIRVQTDGMIRTGRDVVVAALLGADEFGFATVALITMGCIMMRKCQAGTCPVGVATQDGGLRRKFTGNPQHVVNYFRYVAEEARELMAKLGARTIDELIGHTELLDMDQALAHWKSKGLDFSALLAKPKVGDDVAVRAVTTQKHDIDTVLDRQLIRHAAPALERGEQVTLEHSVRNSNRTLGTMLSNAVVTAHGEKGLPPGTIRLNLRGVAGQSLGAFLAPGIEIYLIGEANDYVGKGMAGGSIVVRPAGESPFDWDDCTIVGNTVLYGATGGKAFVAGQAGERFGVRNSGAQAVVEGVGDHGCEYMTGGIIVCLGRTGRNFAAGMSGGFAFVLDEDREFARRCNQGMVDLERVVDPEDITLIRSLIEEHAEVTGSRKARQILFRWEHHLDLFVKVFPHEYRRALQEQAMRAETDETRETSNG